MKNNIMILLFLFIAILNSYCENDTNFLSYSYWDEIFKENDTLDYPIVFVHGIGYNAHKHWNEIAKIISGGKYFEIRYMESGLIYHTYINEKPDRWVWDLSYYTTDVINESINGDLSIYSDRMNKMIDVILKITGKTKIVIVAHSMGGLISRNYMVSSPETWETVHKILTVATPHKGVPASLSFIGQLRDLKKDSEYIKKLDTKWNFYYKKSNKKWGVIGGIDSDTKEFKKKPNLTDSAGPGYVEISSAIPYGEWEKAIDNLGNIDYNTDNFGFRSAVLGTHVDYFLMKNVFRGILWLIKK